MRSNTKSETAPKTAPAPAQPASEPGTRATARMRAYARARLAGATALRQRLYDIAVGDDMTVWSDKPASPAEVVRYARDGAWCSADSRLWRFAGRIYAALVAIPVTVLLDLTEWVVQRPGRLAAAAFLIFILWLIF